jgi:hypothetical protein
LKEKLVALATVATSVLEVDPTDPNVRAIPSTTAITTLDLIADLSAMVNPESNARARA